MSLQKVLSNHLPTCAIHNGSITCTCGIEAARADLARLTNQLREATELLAMFAEQAETLDHTGCDGECEYKQSAAWMQKYIEVKPCNK